MFVIVVTVTRTSPSQYISPNLQKPETAFFFFFFFFSFCLSAQYVSRNNVEYRLLF